MSLCNEEKPQPRASPLRERMTVSSPEDLEVRTMHVFISRALTKIYREAPKKHTQLRQACTEVIGEHARHRPPPDPVLSLCMPCAHR